MPKKKTEENIVEKTEDNKEDKNKEEIKEKTEDTTVKNEQSQEEEVILEKPKEGLATELGEVKELEVHIVEEVKRKDGFEKETWNPKTSLGVKVKKREITDINYALDRRIKILEPEIVDVLLPNLTTDLLMVGQSKGKFGGGQKRVFKQTQKKTQEGNKPKFATFAVIGNEDGYVGVGYGKSRETVPAREKAIRQAKLSIIKIRRGCGDWGCGCGEAHTVPFKVFGKVGSAEITLIPAPKGTGLKVEKECQKILKLAGITDVWSRTEGQTGSKLNLLIACFKALKQLVQMKVIQKNAERLSVIEGSLKLTK
ncbi:MAG: 30S ribosomal protein S5 [Candidatus Woesearchaeota archaeon]|jgi:small subunit ribosomal protein S5|nr:30S ribosomal protein S5 [Candidatus Woesearchaeota archaeon]|tara:strand:- start:6139 stop:7071 length:933 start_codon:yes stop_codon:yes gene_type:complete